MAAIGRPRNVAFLDPALSPVPSPQPQATLCVSQMPASVKGRLCVTALPSETRFRPPMAPAAGARLLTATGIMLLALAPLSSDSLTLIVLTSEAVPVGLSSA